MSLGTITGVEDPGFLSVFESVMIRIIDATEGAVDTTFRYRNEYAEKTTSRLSECRRVLEYIEEREKMYMSD